MTYKFTWNILKLTTMVNVIQKGVIMDNIFLKIPQEKRDCIINAALEEFAKSGFSKASTTAIVEKAGISKGLLFHYFGSKKNLYESLKHFALNHICEVLEEGINFSQQDYFKRAHDAMMLKFSIIETYPYLYEFLDTAFPTLSAYEINQMLTPKMQVLTQKLLTYNIDFSLFRSDIDLEEILSIITLTLQGLIQTSWKRENEHFDHEKFSIECDKYLNNLKIAFYKQE